MVIKPRPVDPSSLLLNVDQPIDLSTETPGSVVNLTVNPVWADYGIGVDYSVNPEGDVVVPGDYEELMTEALLLLGLDFDASLILSDNIIPELDALVGTTNHDTLSIFGGQAVLPAGSLLKVVCKLHLLKDVTAGNSQVITSLPEFSNNRQCSSSNNDGPRGSNLDYPIENAYDSNEGISIADDITNDTLFSQKPAVQTSGISFNLNGLIYNFTVNHLSAAFCSYFDKWTDNGMYYSEVDFNYDGVDFDYTINWDGVTELVEQETIESPIVFNKGLQALIDPASFVQSSAILNKIDLSKILVTQRHSSWMDYSKDYAYPLVYIEINDSNGIQPTTVYGDDLGTVENTFFNLATEVKFIQVPPEPVVIDPARIPDVNHWLKQRQGLLSPREVLNMVHITNKRELYDLNVVSRYIMSDGTDDGFVSGGLRASEVCLTSQYSLDGSVENVVTVDEVINGEGNETLYADFILDLNSDIGKMAESVTICELVTSDVLHGLTPEQAYHQVKDSLKPMNDLNTGSRADASTYNSSLFGTNEFNMSGRISTLMESIRRGMIGTTSENPNRIDSNVLANALAIEEIERVYTDGNRNTFDPEDPLSVLEYVYKDNESLFFTGRSGISLAIEEGANYLVDAYGVIISSTAGWFMNGLRVLQAVNEWIWDKLGNWYEFLTETFYDGESIGIQPHYDQEVFEIPVHSGSFEINNIKFGHPSAVSFKGTVTIPLVGGRLNILVDPLNSSRIHYFIHVGGLKDDGLGSDAHVALEIVNNLSLMLTDINDFWNRCHGTDPGLSINDVTLMKNETMTHLSDLLASTESHTGWGQTTTSPTIKELKHLGQVSMKNKNSLGFRRLDQYNNELNHSISLVTNPNATAWTRSAVSDVYKVYNAFEDDATRVQLNAAVTNAHLDNLLDSVANHIQHNMSGFTPEEILDSFISDVISCGAFYQMFNFGEVFNPGIEPQDMPMYQNYPVSKYYVLDDTDVMKRSSNGAKILGIALAIAGIVTIAAWLGPTIGLSARKFLGKMGGNVLAKRRNSALISRAVERGIISAGEVETDLLGLIYDQVELNGQVVTPLPVDVASVNNNVNTMMNEGVLAKIKREVVEIETE